MRVALEDAARRPGEGVRFFGRSVFGQTCSTGTSPGTLRKPAVEK